MVPGTDPSNTPSELGDIPRSPSVEDRRRVFSEPTVTTLIHTFYGEVRADPMLQPVFAKRIEDWSTHLDRMVSFWRTVLTGDGHYKPDDRGAPHLLHQRIEENSQAHFDRWLTLFDSTAYSILPPRAAEYAVLRARQIGAALAAHLPPTS